MINNMIPYFIIIVIFLFIFRNLYKYCRQNIKEAFSLTEMDLIQGTSSSIGCDGTHGSHHHGSCGSTSCGVGHKLVTTSGMSTCTQCPAGTYKNKNNHTDRSCEYCGENATSPPGSGSCTCNVNTGRLWHTVHKCTKDALCNTENDYKHTKESQDDEINKAAAVGMNDPNGDNDTYNFINVIYDDKCWTKEKVKSHCNNTTNYNMREDNGDFFCAYECSYLKGKNKGIGSADAYECGRDGRSAHQPYCEYGAQGCRGRR